MPPQKPSKAAAKAFISSMKTLKKVSKMDNVDFAKMIGVAESTTRSWFKGRSIPTPERIQNVEKALEAKLHALHNLTAAIENALPRNVA